MGRLLTGARLDLEDLATEPDADVHRGARVHVQVREVLGPQDEVTDREARALVCGLERCDGQRGHGWLRSTSSGAGTARWTITPVSEGTRVIAVRPDVLRVLISTSPVRSSSETAVSMPRTGQEFPDRVIGLPSCASVSCPA